MKWIKTRKAFLEAVGDRLSEPQKKLVAGRWGAKYLEMEEVTPTDRINQGTWKLEGEHKQAILDEFFGADMLRVEATFRDIPAEMRSFMMAALQAGKEEWYTALPSSQHEKVEKILGDLDINNIGLDDIYPLTLNVYARVNVKETISDKRMVMGEDGAPVKDEEGKIITEPKEVGELSFYKGTTDLKSTAEAYNKCAKALGWPEYDRDMNNEEVQRMCNTLATNIKDAFDADVKVFGKDMYLSILHDPQDILNISVSSFYSSCQNLYRGSQVKSLLANVFDPNSIPAIFYLDTPVYDSEGEKIADKLPIGRFFIRSLTGLDKPMIFFDRIYPARLDTPTIGTSDSPFYAATRDLSGNKEDENYITKNGDIDYTYSPDLPPEDTLSQPYQDALYLKHKPMIGKNTKYLSITRKTNWSDVTIDPSNNIKEVVIESPDLPKNMFDLNFDLDWLKIRGLGISEMPPIGKFSPKRLAFENCEFEWKALAKELKKLKEPLKGLSIRTCDAKGMKLAGLQIQDLDISWSSDDKLAKLLKGCKIGKLTISGDMLQDKDNKRFVDEQRAMKAGDPGRIAGSIQIKGIK